MNSIKKVIARFYSYINKILGGKGLWKYYPVRVLYGLVAKNLKSNYVEIHGHKMHLDKSDSLNLSINNSYEEFEYAIMQKLINPGNHVVDVGANIGYFTLLLAKLVGENGKVHAFEPFPSNFEILKKNVEINGYENINLVNKAVMDKKGQIEFFLNDGSEAAHRIFMRDANEQHISVESISLDEYLSKEDHLIDFVKMDIQGAEGHALKGMQQTIAKNKKITILMEFWPYGLVESKTDPKTMLEELLADNFKVFNINDRKKSLDKTTPEELLNKYTIEEKNHTNLLLTKEELNI